MSVGALDAAKTGENDGDCDGGDVGVFDGANVGNSVGGAMGDNDGDKAGADDGRDVGDSDGDTVGVNVGASDGEAVDDDVGGHVPTGQKSPVLVHLQSPNGSEMTVILTQLSLKLHRIKHCVAVPFLSGQYI